MALTAPANEFVEAYLAEAAAYLRAISSEAVARAVEPLARAYREGAQVLVAGNGGSASTAAHLACDLGKTALGAEPMSSSARFRVLSLADNVPLLTAWANDEGFHTVFAEQVKALARPSDILIVLSVSGDSPNIVAALDAARMARMETIGLLGRGGGEAGGLVDYPVVIDGDDYGHVESAHVVISHLMTEWFRQQISAAGPRSAPGAAI